MTLNGRLGKLERTAAAAHARPKTCATCGSPIPSMCASLLLGPKGIYVNGLPCADCAPHGGGGSIPLDPTTGEPKYTPGVVLLDMDFSEWLALHGARAYTGAVALTLRWVAQAEGVSDELLLPDPDTPVAAPAFEPWLVHSL